MSCFLLGTSTKNWVPVAMLLLYVVTSMIGMLPIPWTMTAELFPLEIRGVAHSIAFSIANLLLFASVQSYWTLDEIFHGAAGVQYFFAVIALMGVVYTFLLLPETHKKKLSEITDYFNYNMFYVGFCSKNDKPTKKSNVYRATKKDIVKSNIEQNEKLMEV